MRFIDATSRLRRPAVLGLLIAFWVVTVGTVGALPGTEPPAFHGHHTPAASAPVAPVSDDIDHPHASTGDGACYIGAVVEAVIPRSAVTLIALASVTAVVVLPVLGRDGSVCPKRGPPHRAALHQTGWDLLIQLCVVRR